MTDSLRDSPETEAWAPLAPRDLDRVAAAARAHLEAERAPPVLPHRAGAELRADLDLDLGARGAPRALVLEQLGALLAATPRAAGPGFFNQLYGGRDAMATMAEMLSVVANTAMHTYKVAGPQMLVEEAVLAHMAAKAGYRDGEGTFVPGGSMGNLVAMILARDRAFPEARDHGVPARPLAVYTSTESHYSIRKSLGVAGLGRRRLREVPVDAAGAMDAAALAAMIAADRADGVLPVMINATAGTTVLGAFDPLRAIAAIAREHGAWLHVDASFGGTVLLSPEHRHLLDGSELADSLAWNPHKMMGIPLLCSALLVRRRGLLAKSFDEHADYLFQAHDAELDAARRSIQCGRRNDALKLWCAWRHHGDAGWARRVARQFALAAEAAAMVRRHPELELVKAPQSINVCFRVPGRSSLAICRRLATSGRLLIGHGPVEGRRVIRMVCVDPALGADDLRRALDEIVATARQLPPGEEADIIGGGDDAGVEALSLADAPST